MLNRLQEVLVKTLGTNPDDAHAAIQDILQMTIRGPAREGPHLVLGGTGLVPLRDEEDAHVMDVALAGRADVLATANLADFSDYRTRTVVKGRVLAHATADRRRILIAHPDHVARWLRAGELP
jgi:hypothetical protein